MEMRRDGDEERWRERWREEEREGKGMRDRGDEVGNPWQWGVQYLVQPIWFHTTQVLICRSEELFGYARMGAMMYLST